jgi:hypothetical protein
MKPRPLRTSATVLIVLTVVTLLGVAVIDAHRTTQLLGPGPSVTLILLTAFGKTAAIGYWFMDVRHAPRPLQAAYGGWVAVFAMATIALAV